MNNEVRATGSAKMSEASVSRPGLLNRPRFHLLVGILLLLILVFLVGQFLYWSDENSNAANFFNDVRIGMTKEEVQRILGRPTSSSAIGDDGSCFLTWNLGNAGYVRVSFNSNGKATTKQLHETTEARRSLGDVFRDFLRKLGR